MHPVDRSIDLGLVGGAAGCSSFTNLASTTELYYQVREGKMGLILPLLLLVLMFIAGGALLLLIFVCRRLHLSWRQVSPYVFGASVGFFIALVSTPDALPALEVYLGYLEDLLGQIGLHKIVSACHPFMATIGLFGVLVLTGITIGLFAVWVARKAT